MVESAFDSATENRSLERLNHAHDDDYDDIEDDDDNDNVVYKDDDNL